MGDKLIIDDGSLVVLHEDGSIVFPETAIQGPIVSAALFWGGIVATNGKTVVFIRDGLVTDITSGFVQR